MKQEHLSKYYTLPVHVHVQTTCFLFANTIGMLCKACLSMPPEECVSLPCSTNAVESHNRLSKSTRADPLDVAMLNTYNTDKVAALRHLASLRGLKTTYEDLSEAERLKRSTRANKTRRKRRSEENDGDGPPDKKGKF